MADPDITICIAHRNNPIGLWATLMSCENDLAKSGVSANYSLVLNGHKDWNKDLQETLDSLAKGGKLAHAHKQEEVMSPPNARNLAAQYANGKYICFFDDHCLLGPDYFKRVVANFERNDCDMLHSATIFRPLGDVHYHYKLLLKKNFWGESALILSNTSSPYRIAAGGHGGFAVKADVWREVGGYWDGFKGYGGEEMYFDLKMAMLGKTNWLDPKLVHYHYSGPRGYSRHFTDDYYRNMMACANIIGGEAYYNAVYENFVNSVKGYSDKSMYDLYMDAEEISRDHAAELAKKRLRNLDEQLAYFGEQCIPH